MRRPIQKQGFTQNCQSNPKCMDRVLNVPIWIASWPLLQSRVWHLLPNQVKAPAPCPLQPHQQTCALQIIPQCRESMQLWLGYDNDFDTTKTQRNFTNHVCMNDVEKSHNDSRFARTDKQTSRTRNTIKFVTPHLFDGNQTGSEVALGFM